MKIFKNAALCIFLLLAASMLSALGGGEKAPSELNFNGSVSYMEGTVSINGNEAETGDPVLKGDLVETGSDSLCEIIFNERNIIQLNSISTFRVGGGSLIDFSLEKGSLAVVADKLEKAAGMSERLVVKTPTAVMGVRGTLFYIKVEDENSTYLCICSGKANTYKGDGEGRKLVKSEHHKASRYIKEGDSFKRKPATLLYHDDAVMEALADKINVSVDWGEEKSY